MKNQEYKSPYEFQTVDSTSVLPKLSDGDSVDSYGNKKYNVAIYIRLSNDDAYSDSLSIPNQHAMLNEYIGELNIQGVSVLDFVDNGYTGTNMERPAFQEMLEMVRLGKINCIVVKDFSRFSRNILESGYYIEQVFPLYQVRFIALNERFDSNDYKDNTGGIDVAFKFLINEYYSQDLSKKIKSTRRIQMANGEGRAGNPIYGYRKNGRDNLELDEHAAKVVFAIFDMAVEGLSTTVIKDRLFEAGEPTPRENEYLISGKDIEPKCLWSVGAVRRILANEQYTGTYISGKIAYNGFGGGKVIYADENDWIKIPNHHPAIVSRDTFDKVQALLKNRSRVSKQKKEPRDYLLRGKIRCGCCGGALSYASNTEPTFYCYKTAANPLAPCYKMKVSVGEIDDVVLEIMKKQTAVFLATTDLSSIKKGNGDSQSRAEYERKIKLLAEQSQSIYERFVIHEIDKETYLSLKNGYAAQMNTLNNHFILNRQIEHDSKTKQKIVSQAKTALNENSELKDLVDMLIEKIHILPKTPLVGRAAAEGGDQPGNHIEIFWKVTRFAAGNNFTDTWQQQPGCLVEQ